MAYKYALFDFDGTVADTKEGILSAAAYSLTFFNMTASRETLMKFIGPTLWDSYRDLFGFDKEDQDEAVRRYREYYSEKGIYEASLYDGMKEMLEDLKNKGVKLGIGSSKNEIFVIRALEHFGIRDLFDVIIGSTPEGGHAGKYELIGMLMEHFGDECVSDYIYAGDSRSDWKGAHDHGMDFIAALYDRDPSEFSGCEGKRDAFSVKEMEDIILTKE